MGVRRTKWGGPVSWAIFRASDEWNHHHPLVMEEFNVTGGVMYKYEDQLSSGFVLVCCEHPRCTNPHHRVLSHLTDTLRMDAVALCGAAQPTATAHFAALWSHVCQECLCSPETAHMLALVLAHIRAKPANQQRCTRVQSTQHR